MPGSRGVPKEQRAGGWKARRRATGAAGTRRPSLLAVLLGGALLASTAIPVAAVAAQEPGGPQEYAQAVGALAAGDTASALDLLRAATRRDREFGPAFLLLGGILAERANERQDPQHWGDWIAYSDRYPTPVAAGVAVTRYRTEAAAALKRALELLGPLPEVVLPYGLFVVKKNLLTDTSFITFRRYAENADSLQPIDNAIREAEQRPDEYPPEILAAIYHAMALVYEWSWGVFRYQRFPAQTPGAPPGLWIRTSGPEGVRSSGAAYGPPECVVLTGRAAARCVDVPDVHPAIHDRARMMEYYRKALRLEPGNVEVGLRLLGHIADQDRWLGHILDPESWVQYSTLAHQLAAVLPGDPRAYLFRGLGLHLVGRSDRADSVFQVAKRLMTPAELERHRDITILLPPAVAAEYAAMGAADRRELERIFFTINDPIYLTDVEERRLEHYSRVAWSDLKFHDPDKGLRGSETDQGAIFIRYGEPDVTLQARHAGAGSDGFLTTWRRLRSPALLQIRWDYRLEGFSGRARFSYAFVRAVTASTAVEHTDRDTQYYNLLEHELPQFYRPRTITSVVRYPHQLARFRGSEPHLNRIEVFAGPPLRQIGVRPTTALDAGLFLHDREWHQDWQHKHRVPVGETALRLSYRLEARPGQYHYTLEARQSGPDSVPRPLARSRLALATKEFPRGRVSLSDIVLADDIVPLADVVRRRDDVEVKGSTSLAFQAGDPVHVYFEVYGLSPDRQGVGRYRIELLVADSAGHSVGLAERLAVGLRILLRRPRDPVRSVWLNWERSVPLDTDDDRVPEHLRIELPFFREGEYRVLVTITDLSSGEQAETSRPFLVFRQQDAL